MLQQLSGVQVLEPLAAHAQVVRELLTPRQPRLAPDRPAAGEVLRLQVQATRRPADEPLAELALDREDSPRLAAQHDVAQGRIALHTSDERLLERQPHSPGAEPERRAERRRVARAPVIEHVRDERGRKMQRRESRRLVL